MMKKKSSIEIFLLWYIFLSDFSFGLTLSIWVIYFLSRGVTLSWVGYISGVSAITILLFEFPTGIIADKFGCGLSIFISNILISFSSFLAYISYGNIMFLILSIISAIGTTFSTGALSGWFLKKAPFLKEKLASIYSEINILSNIGKLLGGIIGAIIFSFSKPIPFLLSSILYLTLAISFLLFNKFRLVEISKSNISNPFKDILIHSKESILFSLKEKSIYFILIVTFFFLISAEGPLIYWQPLFNEEFKTSFPIGIIFVLYLLSNILGSTILRISINKIKRFTVIFSLTILFGGIMLFLTGFIKNIYLSIIFFLIYHFTLGIGGPIRMKILNEVIPDEKRASILSFVSLVEGGSEGVAGFIWGYISKFYSLNILFSLISIPIFLSFIISLKIPEK